MTKLNKKTARTIGIVVTLILVAYIYGGFIVQGQNGSACFLVI